MIVLVFIFVFLLSFTLMRWWKKALMWKDFPGPSRFLSLPILGHAYEMAGKRMHDVMRKNHEKYGDVYRFDMGNIQTVFLCKFEDISEAYKMDVFGGRSLQDLPGLVVMKPLDKDGDMAGLTAMESGMEKWKEQKKFTINALNDLGMGKSAMEDIIMDEVKVTCDLLHQKAMENKSGRVAMTRLMSPATNNVIWRIVSGKQTKQDNQDLVDIMEVCKDIFMFFETDSLFKVLQLNSVWFSKLCKWAGVKKNVFDTSDQLRKRLWKEVEEGTPNPQGSFIDRYHYMRQQHNHSCKSIFSERTGMDNLKGSIWDLFLVGTDSTSTFLEWAMLFLIKYPDIQSRLHQEILENIGSRSAVLTDKEKAPFMLCFIEECFRCCHMADVGVPHRAVHDVTFKGRFFPKGTQIIADIDAVMNDPEYWNEPELFKPERFMTAEGKFKSDPRMLLFGIGKRRCMGEVLARAEIFLFLVGLIQNFELRQVTEPCFDPVPGMICYPKEFEAILISRS